MEQVLTNTLTNVAIALLGLASAYAIYFINKASENIKIKTQLLKEENQRELVNSAVNRVSDLAVTTVASIEQQFASSIREAVKDGKIDRKELLALGEVAKDEIYEQLTEETINTLSTTVADLDKYITDKIEKALLELKK